MKAEVTGYVYFQGRNLKPGQILQGEDAEQLVSEGLAKDLNPEAAGEPEPASSEAPTQKRRKKTTDE